MAAELEIGAEVEHLAAVLRIRAGWPMSLGEATTLAQIAYGEMAHRWVAAAAEAFRSGRGDRGCHDNAALVAAYERGVAAGRRQAADAVRDHEAWAAYVRALPGWPGQIGDIPNVGQRDMLADYLIAEGAPAEPVEGADR